MEKETEKEEEREIEGGRGGDVIDIAGVGSWSQYKRSAERASEMATEKPRFYAIYMEEMSASGKMGHCILSLKFHKAYGAAYFLLLCLVPEHHSH